MERGRHQKDTVPIRERAKHFGESILRIFDGVPIAQVGRSSTLMLRDDLPGLEADSSYAFDVDVDDERFVQDLFKTNPNPAK